METSSLATDEDSPTAAGRPRESMHSDGHSQTAAGEYSSLSQDEKNKRSSRGLVPERTTASECATALSPIGGFRHLNKLLGSSHSYDNALHQLAVISRNLRRRQDGCAAHPLPLSSLGEVPLQRMTIRDGTQPLLPVALPSPMPGWQNGVTMSAIELLVHTRLLLATAGHRQRLRGKSRKLLRQRRRSAHP